MIAERMLTLSILPLLAAGFAQAQQPAQDSGVVISTESKLVLVDTIVTDKKGEPVSNLTAKDFKVYEDNKEQQIKSFSSEAGTADPTNAQRRYIVLFFDASTIGFGNQAQARQAAAKFIDANSGPNRMMAIVNFGGAIQIAQNFTDNVERLKAAVNGTKVSAVATNGDSSAPDTLNKAAADFGANDLLLSLRSMAKNLAAIPGRKTLILFTGGFPLTPDKISEVTAVIDSCNKSNVAVYPIDVRGLATGQAPIALLNSPSSLFPASGLIASTAYLPGTLAFFQRTGGGGGGGGGTGGGAGGGRGGSTAGSGGGGGIGRGGAPTAPAPSPGRGGVNPNQMMNPNDPAQQQALQARNALLPKIPDSTVDNQNVMFMLASGTGGFVIKDTNDLFGGLEKIGKELNSYYILGYAPPESEEGSCHTLHVKVDQSGFAVRFRSGYCNTRTNDILTRDMPVEKSLENRVAGTQAGNVAASMQLPFFYTGTNIARVNVAMQFPGDAMKFDKEKGKYHAELNILGIAYRTDGSVGARFSDTVKRDFEDKKQMEAFEKEPFHYENQFDVAAGKYDLKVAFTSSGNEKGDKNDKFGKLEMPLSIDAWESKNFTISGLALSNEIRKTTDASSALDQSLLDDRTPLITQGIQVIPAGSSRFTKAQPPLFYVEVYEPLLPFAGDQKMAIGMQIRVLDRKSGEERFSTGMMRVDLPQGSGNPMVPLGERIPTEKLTAGQYTVEVQALNVKGAKVTRTADFDLE